MNAIALERLDDDIQRLTLSEQVWLLERLAHHIREQTTQDDSAESALEKMASDPAVQRELRTIEYEFSSTEADGLSD